MVCGAVIVQDELLDPLTDMISLLWTPYDNQHLLRVARLFRALKSSIQSLSDYYSTLAMAVPIPRFPFRNSFKVEQNEMQITYISQIEDSSKPIFNASVSLQSVSSSLVPSSISSSLINNCSHIIVKFSQQYRGHQVHNFLAKHGYAPKLIYHDAVCVC